MIKRRNRILGILMAMFLLGLCACGSSTVNRQTTAPAVQKAVTREAPAAQKPNAPAAQQAPETQQPAPEEEKSPEEELLSEAVQLLGTLGSLLTSESEENPKPETKAAPETKTAEERETLLTPAAPRTGIRPEFKAAMDSYEAFYDDYIAIMQSIEKDSSDITVLLKYMDMLGQMEEMDRKFEEWDEDDMSEEELDYYLAVSLRIEQKLLKVLSK